MTLDSLIRSAKPACYVTAGTIPTAAIGCCFRTLLRYLAIRIRIGDSEWSCVSVMTWARAGPEAKCIHYGRSAYSCLAVLPDRSIGLLYEKDDYKRIVFTSITLDWLTDGRDQVDREA